MENVRQRVESELFGEQLAAVSGRCSGHPALEACWSLLEARRLDESLDLALAERYSGVDRSYLNRLLRKATGLTFHQLRIRLRLVEAAVLLLETSESVLDISLDVGFGSFRSFQRNFRRAFGVTAVAYRRLHRSDL